MDNLETQRQLVQETMNFLGALACGMEETLGETATSICYKAGEKLGQNLSQNAKHTDDIQDALLEVNELLIANKCMWHIECFKPSTQPELKVVKENGYEVMLVFRDCMIRQALFRYGHPQKGSLCHISNGFISAALESITGHLSTLEIIHAGENACYKRVTVDTTKNGSQPMQS